MPRSLNIQLFASNLSRLRTAHQFNKRDNPRTRNCLFGLSNQRVKSPFVGLTSNSCNRKRHPWKTLWLPAEFYRDQGHVKEKRHERNCINWRSHRLPMFCQQTLRRVSFSFPKNLCLCCPFPPYEIRRGTIGEE